MSASEHIEALASLILGEGHATSQRTALAYEQAESALAEAFDQALSQVTEGVKRAKVLHAECGETHRQAVSVLVSLEIAIPKTENPYRKEAERG